MQSFTVCKEPVLSVWCKAVPVKRGLHFLGIQRLVFRSSLCDFLSCKWDCNYFVCFLFVFWKSKSKLTPRFTNCEYKLCCRQCNLKRIELDLDLLFHDGGVKSSTFCFSRSAEVIPFLWGQSRVHWFSPACGRTGRFLRALRVEPERRDSGFPGWELDPLAAEVKVVRRRALNSAAHSASLSEDTSGQDMPLYL